MKTTNQTKSSQAISATEKISKLNSNGVDFSVSRGHVLLKGAVDTRSRKADIEKTVNGIPGVRSLKNHISVNHTLNTKKSDQELSEAIAQALKQITPTGAAKVGALSHDPDTFQVTNELTKEFQAAKNFEMDYWKIFVND